MNGMKYSKQQIAFFACVLIAGIAGSYFAVSDLYEMVQEHGEGVIEEAIEQTAVIRQVKNITSFFETDGKSVVQDFSSEFKENIEYWIEKH